MFVALRAYYKLVLRLRYGTGREKNFLISNVQCEDDRHLATSVIS